MTLSNPAEPESRARGDDGRMTGSRRARLRWVGRRRASCNTRRLRPSPTNAANRVANPTLGTTCIEGLQMATLDEGKNQDMSASLAYLFDAT